MDKFNNVDKFILIFGVDVQDPGLVVITGTSLATGRLDSRLDGLPPLLFLPFLTQSLGGQFKLLQTDLLPGLPVEVEHGTGIEHPAEVFDLLHLPVKVFRRRDIVGLDDLFRGLLVLGFILSMTVLRPMDNLEHIELVLTATGDKVLDDVSVVDNHSSFLFVPQR